MRIGRAGLIGVAITGVTLWLCGSGAASQETPVWPPKAWPCPAGAALKRSQDSRSRVQACVRENGSPHGLMGVWDGRGRPMRMIEYRADRENGRVQEWFDNGRQSLDGVFSRGEPNGLWTRWHRNGSIESRVHFADGKFDGPATWWHASGGRRLEGRYRQGKQIGLWVSWREDGTRKSECQWVDGKRMTPCKE